MYTVLENRNDILKNFEAISFEEMGRVKLMNRFDTKYILHINRLNSILEKASKSYFIFQVSDSLYRTYTTSYFDTSSFKMYLNHHNGRLNRYKIRKRIYTDTNEEFLEVKFKNNKRSTIKQRIKINANTPFIDKDSFIKKKSPYNFNELSLSLTNSFTRIMLVSKQFNERVSIDTNLEFLTTSGSKKISNLVIIEQKRSTFNKRTKFTQILQNERIKPIGFSKYCIGMVLTKPNIKSNRFKPKLNLLNAIMND